MPPAGVSQTQVLHYSFHIPLRLCLSYEWCFGAEHVRRNNHQSQGMEGPNSARGVISKARAEVLAAKLAEPQRRYAVQAP